jgi:hypothetical protein
MAGDHHSITNLKGKTMNAYEKSIAASITASNERARLAPQAKAYIEAARGHGVEIAEEGEHLTRCAKAMMNIITASFDNPDTGFPNFCSGVQLKALVGVEELLSMAIFFHQIESDLREATRAKVQMSAQ